MAACLAALFKVALVVFFRAPEGLGRFHFGHNAFWFEDALLGKLFDLCKGLGFLLRRVKEDGGAVLRAPVRSLAVEGGGIVQGEEGVKDLVVGDARRVEVEFDNFRVTRAVCANVFVGGPVELTALVAYSGRGDAGNRGKGGFDAPETARSECCFFSTHACKDAPDGDSVTILRFRKPKVTGPVRLSDSII